MSVVKEMAGRVCRQKQRMYSVNVFLMPLFFFVSVTKFVFVMDHPKFIVSM